MLDATSILVQEKIEILQPPKLELGNGCISDRTGAFLEDGRGQRVFVVFSSSVKPMVSSLVNTLEPEVQAADETL